MNNCAPTLNTAASMSGNNKPFVIAGVFDMMGGKPSCHLQTGGGEARTDTDLWTRLRKRHTRDSVCPQGNGGQL